MSLDGPPGEPPEVAVEVEADLGRQGSPQGFLQIHCRSLRRRFDDGTASAPFSYDVLEREHLDAVVIVLYRRRDDRVEVVVRSQLRVPLVFRHEQEVPDSGPTCPVLWELPAGLIERGEQGPAGIARRASAETFEEAGYSIAPGRFAPLGAACFPSPGLVAEKFHFVRAQVHDAERAVTPAGDGHPLEQGPQIEWLELGQALRAADAGRLPDMKTELGVRRLAACLELGL